MRSKCSRARLDTLCRVYAALTKRYHDILIEVLTTQRATHMVQGAELGVALQHFHI